MGKSTVDITCMCITNHECIGILLYPPSLLRSQIPYYTAYVSIKFKHARRKIAK